MNLILFDPSPIRENLLPLTFTRPVASIRVGISTIEEKWTAEFLTKSSFLTQHYLEKKFSLTVSSSNLLINGALCPEENLVAAIRQLSMGQALMQDGSLLAAKCNAQTIHAFKEQGIGEALTKLEVVLYPSTPTLIRNVWDIFVHNGSEIRSDFGRITKGRATQLIQDKYTQVYSEENIFIEEGAIIKSAILNAENGPIYIGKDTEIMEGATIRGPFALCEGAIVSMGAKIRGDSTIGPFSKAGGEISNSVIFANSNKGHDGFLGNSVLGEWCNLGAATNTSNLKNNYGEVKLWNYTQGELVSTGRQFCGLIMGDHTRCGINTMFNTGTVAGVGANIFGAGFKSKFIPSFSWSEGQEFSLYRLDKFFETAGKVMERRNKVLDNEDKNILTHIFEQTALFRNWER